MLYDGVKKKEFLCFLYFVLSKGFKTVEDTYSCVPRTIIYWHGEIKKKNELFKNLELVSTNQ